jgi:hypothetical protein
MRLLSADIISLMVLVRDQGKTESMEYTERSAFHRWIILQKDGTYARIIRREHIFSYTILVTLILFIQRIVGSHRQPFLPFSTIILAQLELPPSLVMIGLT